MQILVFAILAVSCCSLNLSSDEEEKFYDPEAYRSSLEKVQDEVELKIEQIKVEIKEIHDIIDNVQITETVRLVRLSESMADERDSLYQMQQILKVPFQIRKCKCAALDNQTRTEVNAKIQKIAASITKMKNSLRKCTFDKCPRYEELVLELNQEQNYLNIIDETVNSECCESPYILEDETATGLVDLSGSLYKDNLKASGWFYGTISKTDYILSRFQLATKYNLTSCPLQTPYVNLFENTCFNCSEKEYFSLGNRKCYGCQDDQYFNTNQSRCIDCPPHQFYNYTLGQCSHCPVLLVFDEEKKACVPCSRDSYPEFESSVCIKCPLHHYYDPLQEKCVTCDLNKGQYLNLKTLECDVCPNASFFSLSESKCVACPGESYFNSDSQKCVTCPNSLHYFAEQGKCGSCAQNQFYNPNARKCQKCQQGLIFNDVIKGCVPDQAQVIGHEKCPSNYPYYNKYADKCQKCPMGQFFDLDHLTCRTKHYISICPPERPLYKKEVVSCEACPKEIPQYDPYYHICIACPDTKQYFNPQNLICESCQQGYSYNTTSKACELVQFAQQGSVTQPEPTSLAPLHHLQESEHVSQVRISPIVYSAQSFDQNYRYPYAQPFPEATTAVQQPDSIQPTPISTQFVTQAANEGPHKFPGPYSVAPSAVNWSERQKIGSGQNREERDPRTAAQNEKVQINPSTIPILTLKPFSNTPDNSGQSYQCSSLDEYKNWANGQCQDKSKRCLKQQKYNLEEHKCTKECFKQQQIYDYGTESCRVCGESQYYSQENHKCEKQTSGQIKCENDQFFSQQQNKCLKDFQKCNDDQFLNTLTGNCERKSDYCTIHQFYNSSLHQCQHRSVLCLNDQEYDEETMLCLDKSSQ